jgi:UDP-glucose 4-epimerase
MKVVVTGSAGFIGGHVAHTLLAKGHDVIGYDLREGQSGDFPTVVGDFLDSESLQKAFKGRDAVCHIGAIGDVYLAAQDPVLASSVNVTGSANVAQAARDAGVRVVYASTWEVYGHPHYEPVDEDHPCDPDHPYNITKLAGERMLLSAARLEQLPALALRLGTAFGVGMRPNSVFRIFIDKARRGEPITIQGDGSQGRQFTHVSDIAEAFSLGVASDATGMALNVVAPELITVKQLADIVSERYPTEVTYGDPRPGDVPPSFVSSARISEVLGWQARVSFQDGMEELFDEAS